jgi:hypothetical protein
MPQRPRRVSSLRAKASPITTGSDFVKALSTTFVPGSSQQIFAFRVRRKHFTSLGGRPPPVWGEYADSIGTGLTLFDLEDANLGKTA